MIELDLLTDLNSFQERRVYKYPLKYKRYFDGYDWISEWEQHQIIQLPAFSQVLHINFQEDDLVLWAKVDYQTKNLHNIMIEIVGTGHDIKYPNSTYLNTFFHYNLVFHAFVDYGMFNK